MRKFLALLKIQLLARFSPLKPSNLKKVTDKKEKRKLMGTVAAYAMLIILFAAAIIPLEYLMLQAMAQIGQESLLPGMAITASMVCTLIMSFFFIMTSLYFGKDAAYLAALPIKNGTVLSAKLTQVWISETAISALFILPASILYGIQVGVDALFYVRMVLVWLTVSVLPICIVTFLSALLIRLTALWKHREMMMTVGGMALMLAYFAFVFSINSNPQTEAEAAEAMMEMLTKHNGLLQSITRMFPPAAWAADGLLGDWGKMGLSLLVNVAAVAFTIWAMQKPYRKLSLLQTENPVNKKVLKGEKIYRSSTPFMACAKREMKQLTRVSTYALNTFPTAIMPVFFVGMICYTMSTGTEGPLLKSGMTEMGMPAWFMVAVITVMCCFMAGLNPAVYTAVTREGRNGHGMLTSLPVNPRVYIKAKMFIGMVLSAGGLILAGIVGSVLMPGFAVDMAVAVVLGFLYCYAVNAVSLTFDVKKPKLDWMTETEAVKQSASVWKGMLLSFALLLVLVGASVGLFLLKVNYLVYVLAVAALLGACCYGAHQLLMKTADRNYWQA